MKERSGWTGERVYDGKGGRPDMLDALTAAAVRLAMLEELSCAHKGV